MSIYIYLIVLVLVASLMSKVFGNPKHKDTFVLLISGIALFAIYVLRDYSVGRDILGYYEIYDSMHNHVLFDASWTWMEWGYVLLMKLASMLGLSFRGFLAIVYSMILIPLGVFVKRYSQDVTLSVIIFICFQFFVFSMSAIRQTLAMSICLTAYMVANRNGFKSFLLYCILVFYAFLVHRSAIVFVPAYLLMRKKLDFGMILIYLIVLFLAFITQGDLLGRLSDLGESNNVALQENLSIGTFTYFMSFIIVVAFIVVYRKARSAKTYSFAKSITGPTVFIQQSLTNHLNLFVCCVLIQIVFQGFMLMRAATFYQIFLLLVLPNLIEEFPKDMQFVLRVAVIIGMFFIFYYATLLPNELDIVPFLFGV